MRGLPTEGGPGRKGVHVAGHCVPQRLIPRPGRGWQCTPWPGRALCPHHALFPRNPRALQPPELEGHTGTSPAGTAGPGWACGGCGPAAPRRQHPAPPGHTGPSTAAERLGSRPARRGEEPSGEIPGSAPAPYPHSPGWGRWPGRRGRPLGSQGCRAAP